MKMIAYPNRVECPHCGTRHVPKRISKAELRKRIKAGIAKAKAAGKYGGRKPGTCEAPEKFLAKPRSQAILELLMVGHTIQEIVNILHVSSTTVVKTNRFAKAFQLPVPELISDEYE